MKLSPLDLLHRRSPPTPWSEGETIPWDEPGFSRRMLREHLSQAHDAASRRFETIDRHVAWIASLLPTGCPSRILDLGCGPGLYAQRLAAQGHAVRGIDFSPASIEYARDQAAAERLEVEYLHADMREADFGAGYDLAMLIFGEFNVFNPADARRILRKSHAALADGGLLLLEPHPFEAVRALGEEPGSWYTTEQGLWSGRSYLCLQENFWDADRAAGTNRYFIVDLETAEVAQHSAGMQAYTDEGYLDLLTECGFGDIEFHPSLTGSAEGMREDLFVILARKRMGE
jgi:SAM-dependent methyltransferase